MLGKTESKYGWLIIALGGLTYIAMGLSHMCMPVLFNEISRDLNLSIAQLGVIWGTVGLGSMLMSPFGGLLGDKYGTKHVIFVACILLGIIGALRSFASGFSGLFLTTLLFGFAHTTIALNMHKCTGVWFTGKKVVIANGILCTAMGAGLMISAMISDTIMSPLLGGWNNVLLLYGAISIVIGLIWSVTRPNPVHQANNENPSAPLFRESLLKVFHSRELWYKTLMNMLFFGTVTAFCGYLPVYLKGIGWAPAMADNALALLNGASVLGAIPLAIIAGKTRSKKKVIGIIFALDLLCLSVFPFIKGFMIWIDVGLFGLIIDGYVAVLTTTVIETNGIGARYAGTAIGMVFTFGNLGIFMISSLGNSLAEMNMHYSFILWAVFISMALGILPFAEKRKLRGKMLGSPAIEG
jgi:predicted MFS family arabinose efflux permease